jgi:hypothetical protein
LIEKVKTMDPEIRDYLDTDLPGVVSLWQECFPEVRHAAAFREMIARKQATQTGPFLVAESDGNVVGTVVVGMDGLNAWIYLVGVDPAFRRAGLGSRLVHAVEDRLKQLGVPYVCLQVMEGRQHLLDFYTTLGYRVDPRVSMVKMISRNGSNHPRSSEVPDPAIEEAVD